MSRLLLSISAILLIVPVCPAQTVTGALTGTVTDPTGAVVPNVRITATNDATNLAYTAVANESGVYNVLFLPLGNYTVAAEAPGFKKAVMVAGLL